ncbi:MAG: uracil phosphoribosyltransferase [Bacteroidetes bacterium]|jgi:uracil phosphoribosyltransferase|nr:uracil phosphoribosyltransferase [Bacteroidota bacterium]MBT6687653.1 uracil phosphoribosyltransferase [Bacteroidota bacterium]MBT7142848.1 uracil phosphoribosyltransferase [Bacteroidota bacterium]MBT7492580.1 uracil phosphoribosyltransferase [Bacteroidota bacterium]
MIYILNENNSILNQFIAEIRDENIQKDKIRFRRNLERIGEIIAYEISKKLEFSEKLIQTSLGISNTPVLSEKLVLGTILRAGLPFHQGLLNYFDSAENAFVSAYRKYNKDGSFDIEVEYISSPNIEEKTLILADPMLATGLSMVLAYKSLLENGIPAHTHIVSIIASREGVEYLNKHLPTENITLWIIAIDDELTAKSYIVPGLGDAGDLAYGSKGD